MATVFDVAKYIFDAYKSEANENITELKLHKLLYFAQRESFAIRGIPLFHDHLEGWIHGPVSPEVRRYFDADRGLLCRTEELTPEETRIVNNVLVQYGPLAAWKLRNMSHNEISWKNSRIGLSETDYGSRDLDLKDIMEDAKKVRPFDSTWGMYYDEFDEYDEVTAE